jgi:glycosyltransferase involved in cell wall biosynthesis
VIRVIARLNVGGPTRHATLLNDGLRRHGFDPLLVYGSIDPTEGSLEDLVERLGLRAHRIPELGRRISLWSDASALWQLTRIVFRERPDIVHTHTAKAGTLGRLAALAYNITRPRRRRCVVIHTFHGHVFSGYFGPAGSYLVRLLERGLALATDRILTISARQQHDISVRYRIAPVEKTAVIELGLDFDDLLALDRDARAREPFGFAPGDVVFGYVGRFAPVKNLPALVRAFGAMATRRADVRLLLVGDGEARPALEALTASLGIAERVRFAGWRRDIDAVYGSIDVGVLSSLNEGTPVALIEAMAAARPVIATAVGGVEDLVVHGRSGLVVPSGDEDALADAMDRLAADAGARLTLGAAARESVRTRFGRARLEAEISRCYGRVLEEKRRDPPQAR